MPRICGTGLPSSAVGAPNSPALAAAVLTLCGGGVSSADITDITMDIANEMRKETRNDIDLSYSAAKGIGSGQPREAAKIINIIEFALTCSTGFITASIQR